MRPVSERFLRTLRVSHPVTTECELLFPDINQWLPVELEGGELTFDRTAVTRRTGSIQTPWSFSRGQEIGVDIRWLPLGGWAQVRQGMRYPDGSSELCALGLYRVEAVSWRTIDEVATVELADRMAQVRDTPFLTAFPASGKRIAQACVEIVHGVLTPPTHVLYDPPITLADVTYTGSRTDALTDLARAFGGDVYFDGDGALIVDGPPGAVVIDRTATLTDDSPVVAVDTSGLMVGMPVYGLGVFPGTRVRSIDNAGHLTLSRQVNIWGLKNARLQTGSPVVREISDVSDLFAGMDVTSDLPAVAAGTKIQSIDHVEWLNGIITLTQPVTAEPYPVFLTFTAPNTTTLTFTSPLGPQPLGDPVWTIDAGATGVLVSGDESLDRTAVYNGVLVEGQATADQPPIRALVVDSDQSSPTRWGGPFGAVARIESSNAVQTVDQATDAAQVLLDGHLGLTRTLTIQHAPNPALEAGDVVHVVFGDGREEDHLIDALRLGLGPESPQQLVTHSVFTPAQGDRQVPLPTRTRRVYYGQEAARQLRQARRLVAA